MSQKSNLNSSNITGVKLIVYHNSKYMAESAPLFERIKFEQEIRKSKSKDTKVDEEDIVVLYSGE